MINKVIGVDCKILSLKSGAEFKDHTEELIEHFNVYGTPIMIGGGVLAYTLLGIELTPKGAKYLILDPHYVGEENVQTIVSKGWCSWKEESMFKKSEFYNLCMPLVI